MKNCSIILFVPRFTWRILKKIHLIVVYLFFYVIMLCLVKSYENLWRCKLRGNNVGLKDHLIIGPSMKKSILQYLATPIKWRIKMLNSILTAQNCTKTVVPYEDFFSKCDQIRCFQRIWSHLLKKLLLENFIFLCSASLDLFRANLSLYFKDFHYL